VSRKIFLSCLLMVALLTPAVGRDRRDRTPEWQLQDLERNSPPGWRVERNWAPLGDRGNPLRRDYDKWDCGVDVNTRTIRCDK
jgi:transposase InsO family protein